MTGGRAVTVRVEVRRRQVDRRRSQNGPYGAGQLRPGLTELGVPMVPCSSPPPRGRLEEGVPLHVTGRMHERSPCGPGARRGERPRALASSGFGWSVPEEQVRSNSGRRSSPGGNVRTRNSAAILEFRMKALRSTPTTLLADRDRVLSGTRSRGRRVTKARAPRSRKSDSKTGPPSTTGQRQKMFEQGGGRRRGASSDGSRSRGELDAASLALCANVGG